MNAPVSLEKDSSARLPRPMLVKTFDGLQGRFLLRPWYDWCGVRAIVNWYFPLSRAWAAALQAEGDLDAFNGALGTRIRNSGLIRSALEQTSLADRAYLDCHQRWESCFFGEGNSHKTGMATAEVERQALSKRRMLCRKAYLPWRRKFPKLLWAVSPREDVERDHGKRLLDLDSAFAAPSLPVLEQSGILHGNWDSDAPYRQYWLRFPSLVSGEEGKAWAKVYEPETGATDAPCIIFLHGIGMETDFWGEMTDPVNMLTKQGFRVIRPEAPWHGHRRLHGQFGGEPAIGQGPLGFIGLFHAWVREVAQLIEWARRNGSPQVAVGGLSLGALTAQIVATQARNWSSERRPDQLLLITTSEDMLDIALRGSMARLLEMPRRFAEAGWAEADLARWTPLLEPHGDPVMAADRIVTLLGRADDLTPIKGGENLMRRWNVPENNIFRKYQGHFSASLGLYQDNSVLMRLAEIMKADR
ncbi:alpha/beta hydrolase [Pelagibius sp. Alg239-R121]|uniref:alpha/beta hydrolase n=1 Tax=Pelagibius sp. Alg239-R121 TaxID=2993448 RepID=UPI0024A6BAD5|nr:alpha/beta hydrolase family protein [Pelagibius sp. Alg239-R121]